jgi:DNA-binding NtrC family response regulator
MADEVKEGGKPRVLLVEDTVYLARLYEKYLQDEPYDLVHVETGAEALQALEHETPDAVLLDLVLPDMHGFDILKGISERKAPVSVVVITAHGSVDTAVQAMRYGAFDFLIKPFSAERLMVTLRNALERQHLSKIIETYRLDFDRNEYCGFIGASLAMQSVYRIIDSAASSRATVFITGESGTGKEICAQAIHSRSPRADKPFIALNCGAIPKDLMESEVFGHVKGAFTGAHAERDGAATRADGGTLFLDEICEMDLSLQAKLLRFVQTGTYQKVGGNHVEEVDVRFVCATNRDPLEEVTAERFREDLYYRLHVIPIHLPPLREREDDAVLIARSFLADYAREEGKRFACFAPEIEDVIASYSWPGNVRQLQNMVRSVVVLNDGDTVTQDMMPDPPGAVPARSGNVGMAAGARAAGGQETAPTQRIRPLAEVEREAIERAIELCGGNIAKAAGSLGVSPSTLYRKRVAEDRRH